MNRRDFVFIKGTGHMVDCLKCHFNPDDENNFRPTDGFFVCDEVEERLGKCTKGYWKKVKRLEVIKQWGNNLKLADGKLKITLNMKDIKLPFEWSDQLYIFKDGEIIPYEGKAPWEK